MMWAWVVAGCVAVVAIAYWALRQRKKRREEEDMTFGLKVWDEAGQVTLDTESKVLNILGSLVVGPASSGSVSIPQLPSGTPAYFLEPQPYSLGNRGAPIFPKVTLSSSALSWSYPSISTSGNLVRVPCKVMYGVF